MDIGVSSGRVIGGRCIEVLFEKSTVCTKINITLLQRGWVTSLLSLDNSIPVLTCSPSTLKKPCSLLGFCLYSYFNTLK